QGFWYNRDKTIRLPVQNRTTYPTPEIRQYQSGDRVVFTRIGLGTEELLDQRTLDEKTWEKIHQFGTRCYQIPGHSTEPDFCRTGNLGLYSYHRVSLVGILHGMAPQIPH